MKQRGFVFFAICCTVGMCFIGCRNNLLEVIKRELDVDSSDTVATLSPMQRSATTNWQYVKPNTEITATVLIENKYNQPLSGELSITEGASLFLSQPTLTAMSGLLNEGKFKFKFDSSAEGKVAKVKMILKKSTGAIFAEKTIVLRCKTPPTVTLGYNDSTDKYTVGASTQSGGLKEWTVTVTASGKTAKESGKFTGVGTHASAESTTWKAFRLAYKNQIVPSGRRDLEAVCTDDVGLTGKATGSGIKNYASTISGSIMMTLTAPKVTINDQEYTPSMHATPPSSDVEIPFWIHKNVLPDIDNNLNLQLSSTPPFFVTKINNEDIPMDEQGNRNFEKRGAFVCSLQLIPENANTSSVKYIGCVFSTKVPGSDDMVVAVDMPKTRDTKSDRITQLYAVGDGFGAGTEREVKLPKGVKFLETSGGATTKSSFPIIIKILRRTGKHKYIKGTDEGSGGGTSPSAVGGNATIRLTLGQLYNDVRHEAYIKIIKQSDNTEVITLKFKETN
jgi:hypothetical protein